MQCMVVLLFGHMVPLAPWIWALNPVVHSPVCSSRLRPSQMELTALLPAELDHLGNILRRAGSCRGWGGGSLAWPLSLSCSAHMSAPGWMGSRHQETVGWGVLLRDRKDVWGRLPGQMHNKSQGFMYINIQKVYGWGVLPGQIN